MAINIHELVGRFIAVDKEVTIQSTREQGKTFNRRQLYMDCSRYDGLTGERMDENFPLLEFGGKALDQLNQLVKEGIQKGDLICVTFVVDGVKYTKDGKTQVMTKVRPIGVVRWQRKNQPQQGQQQQAQVTQQTTQQTTQQATPAPNPGPASKPEPEPKDDGLPF